MGVIKIIVKLIIKEGSGNLLPIKRAIAFNLFLNSKSNYSVLKKFISCNGLIIHR